MVLVKRLGLSCCLCCALPVVAYAQTLRTVVLTGHHATGTQIGVNYNSFYDLPVLNSAGQTAFLGELSGSGVNSANDYGIWSEGSGPLGLVAREGDAAPGTPNGVVFTGFDSNRFLPSLNSAGRTAFLGKLIGSGIDLTNNSGIWSEGSGSMSLVAREGSPAPDVPNGVFFGEFFWGPALNSNGHTAFDVRLKGTDINFGNAGGIWSEASGSLSLIAREDNPVPGGLAGVRFGSLANPVLNSNGQTAFVSYLRGDDIDSTNDQGVWSEGIGTLSLVAHKGDQAPGMDTGVSFGNFGFSYLVPAFNSAGQTAFTAFLTGSGIDDTNDLSVWSEGSGALSLIAHEGNPAADTPVGVDFDGFFDPTLNSAGQVAFYAGVRGSGVVNGSNDRGIWSEGFGALSLVARGGDQAPGTAIGTSFNDFIDEPVLNSAGQVAFHGWLIGNGVDSTNDFGIWAQDIAGELQLIVRHGEQLEVTPGDFRTVQYVGFVGSTGDLTGRGNGFNDFGQLAFKAWFTDGTQGIFVSNLVANDGATSGDFDNDSDVDGEDFLVWQRGGSPTPLSPTDLAAWENNYGTVPLPLATTTQVPEPTSVMLVTLSGLIFYGRLNRPRLLKSSHF